MECYDQITEAIAKLPEAEKCGTLTKGQKISVAGAEITVMNEPFAARKIVLITARSRTAWRWAENGSCFWVIWLAGRGRFSCQSYAGGTEIGCATDGAPWAERRRRGALSGDFTGGLLMADAGLALG